MKDFDLIAALVGGGVSETDFDGVYCPVHCGCQRENCLPRCTCFVNTIPFTLVAGLLLSGMGAMNVGGAVRSPQLLNDAYK